MKTMLKMVPALILAVGASGAYAAKTSAADANGGAQASASQAPARAGKAKRYCATVKPFTGSRISREQCLTRAEWEAMGVELKKDR